MKKSIYLVLLSLTLISFSSCTSSKPDDKEPDSSEATSSIYNIPDLEAYAECMNSLAAANNMSAFLWDCSTYMDRNYLNNKYPSCTKKMISAYGNDTEIGNSGNDSLFEEEDAFTAVKNFRAGWNLGNTLDSTSFNINNVVTGEVGWILKYGKKDSEGKYYPSDWENAWGQKPVTEDIVDFVLAEGFNAIRIPVTWAEHFDENDIVDELWMNRVKETVDLFYNKGVYVILNVHHDGGADGWIEATQKSFETYGGRFEKLWQQISSTFMDYDERLLFESMNEVLDGANNWGFSPDGCNWVNKWNQLFVDTVRATGGNNTIRNLVVMTYAGNGGGSFLLNFKLPKDTVKNHLIVEVHNYDPQGFTWTNATWTKMTAKWSSAFANELKTAFAVYKKFSDNLGVPFIVGEYCADPKKYEDYD